MVSLSFIDEDLDAFQLGGIVRWEECSTRDVVGRSLNLFETDFNLMCCLSDLLQNVTGWFSGEGANG